MTAKMQGLTVLSTKDAADWIRVLDQCAPYDFYHLPEYHALAERSNEGAAHLFVFTEGAYTIGLPLLIRAVPDQLGTPGLKDASSVYGYAGPVCSHSEIPAAVAANFQAALTERLRAMQVVAVFSRLHPLLTQRSVLAGLGEFRFSRTAAIDLTLPPDVQRSKYRKPCREGVNKLRRLGLTVIDDVRGTYLDEFTHIYHETMDRVAAADRYYFSRAYFQDLWESLGSRIHLFVCLHEDRVVCASLFTACHGIIQYHLSGTRNDSLKLAPMKLLIDEARLWGISQGMKVLHLGGGTTADPDDSLLHYKLNFTDQTHEFAAWRWVLSPDQYDRLSASAAAENARRGVEAANDDFFPAFRAPTVPCVLPTSLAPEPEQSPLTAKACETWITHGPASQAGGLRPPNTNRGTKRDEENLFVPAAHGQ